MDKTLSKYCGAFHHLILPLDQTPFPNLVMSRLSTSFGIGKGRLDDCRRLDHSSDRMNKFKVVHWLLSAVLFVLNRCLRMTVNVLKAAVQNTEGGGTRSGCSNKRGDDIQFGGSSEGCCRVMP